MGLGKGDVNRILDSFELSPSRALGQNFLVDPNISMKICNLAELVSDDVVVEVGPGIGSLTVELSKRVQRVIAIELDRHIIPALSQVLDNFDIHNVEIMQTDAMKVDFDIILGVAASGKLVANLPYNISVPLVITILEKYHKINEMVVMVQREVGERMCATPGGSLFSQVALKMSYFSTAKIVSSVSRNVFVPRPNVDSVLVRITRRPASELVLGGNEYEMTFELARKAFGNRRQMLRRTLASELSVVEIEAVGIDSTRRPETLTLNEWGLLAGVVLARSL